MAPEIWFCPNSATPDTLELFRNPDAWARARSFISVWQFLALQIHAGDDPAEYPDVGPNRLPAFVEVNAFDLLRRWGIRTAVEAGAVKDGDCKAEDNTQNALRLLERMRNVGVSYVGPRAGAAGARGCWPTRCGARRRSAQPESARGDSSRRLRPV
jgi:hypothetical protein